MGWLLLAFVAGFGLAVQARVNGELGTRLDDGIVAALVSFAVGLVILVIATSATRAGRRGVARLRGRLRSGETPYWMLLGGVGGAVTVSAQGLAAAPLGVALFTVGVVAGQSLSGLAVDRMGFAGLARRPISGMRIAGAVLTLLAVSLSLIGVHIHGSPLLVALPFVSGLVLSFQQALNAQLQRAAGSAMTSTTVNFGIGTVMLLVVSCVSLMVRGWPEALPSEPWLYLGGVLGLVFVMLSAVVVHHTGVLMFGLSAIAGQVAGALVLDAFGGRATPLAIAGAAVAIAGVIVTADPRRIVRRLRRRQA